RYFSASYVVVFAVAVFIFNICTRFSASLVIHCKVVSVTVAHCFTHASASGIFYCFFFYFFFLLFVNFFCSLNFNFFCFFYFVPVFVIFCSCKRWSTQDKNCR